MKRELKRRSSGFIPASSLPSIAEPIPMKRELKRIRQLLISKPQTVYCRAYPDEKGIETCTDRSCTNLPCNIAEPIPMKRELKPAHFDQSGGIIRLDCRAYPDEKGIETMQMPSRKSGRSRMIAEPIPMKRELKLTIRGIIDYLEKSLQSLSR